MFEKEQKKKRRDPRHFMIMAKSYMQEVALFLALVMGVVKHIQMSPQRNH